MSSRRPVAEPEVHLLPASFIGQVAIRHGRADGAPAEREGDARLYRIPADGVLSTVAPANYGVRPPARMQFFWLDAQGARTPIPGEDDEGAAGPRVLATYQVGPDLYYVVDRPENAGRYKNPALSDAEDRG